MFGSLNLPPKRIHQSTWRSCFPPGWTWVAEKLDQQLTKRWYCRAKVPHNKYKGNCQLSTEKTMDHHESFMCTHQPEKVPNFTLLPRAIFTLLHRNFGGAKILCASSAATTEESVPKLPDDRVQRQRRQEAAARDGAWDCDGAGVLFSPLCFANDPAAAAAILPRPHRTRTGSTPCRRIPSSSQDRWRGSLASAAGAVRSRRSLRTPNFSIIILVRNQTLEEPRITTTAPNS